MTDREKEELAAQVLAVIRARFQPPSAAETEEILNLARGRIQEPPPLAEEPEPPVRRATASAPGAAPDTRRVDLVLSAAGAVLIAAYFFRLTRASLHVYFSPDDLMNLYRSWIFSAGQLLKANLLFFLSSDFMRPLGSVWYRLIFDAAGFHPFWFHAAYLLILAANIWLTYLVSRRLAGSETGSLTALITAYQAPLGWLYFNSGYIYDVLCYFFVFAALALYLRVRERATMLRHWQWGALLALYICALNSKEMAAVLPAFLGCYELLYHPPRAWQPAAVIRWFVHEGRATLLGGAVAVLFVAGRSMGPLSLISNPAYRPSFTWTQFLLTSGHFLGDFFKMPDWPAWEVLLLWTVLAAVAAIVRSRALCFAWLFLMISPLPIAFIPPRGVEQYYVCMFGWTLYAAILLVKAASLLTKDTAVPEWWRSRVRGAALFVAVMAILYAAYKPREHVFVEAREPEDDRNTISQLHAAAPALRHGSSLLFLNDPVPPDWFNLIFMVRLSYMDQSLRIFRVKEMKQPPTEQQVASYDYVFDYRDERFYVLKRPLSAAN